jgi:hypothetical protein
MGNLIISLVKFRRSKDRFYFMLNLTIKIIINGFGVYAILFMLQVNFFFMVIFEKRLTYFM